MNTEHRWTRITHASNIPPREGRAVKAGNVELAIFNLNGRFHTIENSCPHRGGPLCDGIVTGTSVVCPLHGRHFDLLSGMPVRAAESACLAVFPTMVEDGVVLVDLTAGRRAA
jgi:nitrite reductase (NADH) small subunit